MFRIPILFILSILPKNGRLAAVHPKVGGGFSTERDVGAPVGSLLLTRTCGIGEFTYADLSGLATTIRMHGQGAAAVPDPAGSTAAHHQPQPKPTLKTRERVGFASPKARRAGISAALSHPQFHKAPFRGGIFRLLIFKLPADQNGPQDRAQVARR